MKKETLNQTIINYIHHLSNSDWIIYESYKFEFANFVNTHVDFQKQTDEEIFSILLKSQKIKFEESRGVQFILKSGRKTASSFIQLNDISLFRQFQTQEFNSIDWNSRTMSYTALSVWLSSLFPDRLLPVSAVGYDKIINYLFKTEIKKFPKEGIKYIMTCQDYMSQTLTELQKYPFDDIILSALNVFFIENPELEISKKDHLERVDWNWLVQDFYLYVFRIVLKAHEKKGNNSEIDEIVEDFKPGTIEGRSKLATHIRYERNTRFIKVLKNKAFSDNPMLNCEVCGFSFFEKYGKIGKQYIEAHHIVPLSFSKETRTVEDGIALICSNCHIIFHKMLSEPHRDSKVTVDELKKIINE